MENPIRAQLLTKVGGLETFTRFWSWRSHVAEKRAEEALASAESLLVQGQAALAAANADNDTMTAWVDRFFKHWHAYMVAGSRTANPMITGPANFPVARNQKAMARAMALGDAYWQFANGTQEFIRRMERSKEKAELSALSSNTEHKTYSFAGGNLVYNTTLDRVQLVFDEKPTEDQRALLNKAAFRWSPRENAWQRKLTNNGVRAATSALVAMGIAKLEFDKET